MQEKELKMNSMKVGKNVEETVHVLIGIVVIAEN